MTLTLLLIRHAKADRDDPPLGDHERSLARRGRLDAPRMGRWIAEQGFAPDEVFCSDAVRTRETLELMLPAWPEPPRLSYRLALYHAAPETMLAVLAEAKGRRVALVGHNPGVGALAARLARTPPDHPRWSDYPTCATAVLCFDADDWSAVGERQGRVLAFGVPADLD